MARTNTGKRNSGTGLCILLIVAMVVLFFVASIAVSFIFVVLLKDDQQQHAIGINYGRVADNLPPPTRAVELIQSLNIRSVKIYDANPDVLKAFQGTSLRLSIMVTNQQVQQMSDSANFSDQWVQENIVAYPSAHIETAIVGNEILSDQSVKPLWTQLVPAMENLQTSLEKYGYAKSIKVTTSLAIDCLRSSYPPSNGVFRDDIGESVILPMLKFLDRTGSFFFINVYPYFAWLDAQQRVPLDYALFRGAANAIQDSSGLYYENLLDAQLDALVVAMTRLGYGAVKVAISETGWPSKGNSGASVFNAADYNRRLVRRILGKSSRDKNRGTPRRPGWLIKTYIFALFNEDGKPGAPTERNWGLLYPNGSKVYDIDLTGKTPLEKYSTLTLPSASPSPSASASISTPTPPQVSRNSTTTSSYVSTPAPQNVPELPRALNPNSTSLRSNSTSSSLKNSTSGTPGAEDSKQEWCVAKDISSLRSEDLQGAVDYACGDGKADCKAIQPGERCFLPNLVQLHASYAFNSYWQKMKRSGGSCSFNGAARLTNVNPSYGACEYPVL